MSPRARVMLIVALAAAAAAGVAVGATLLTGGSPHAAPPAAHGRPGAPPLVLDLGVREDAEAAALRRGALLYGERKRGPAGRIFARYDSLPAQIGSAFAAWPDGTVPRMESLGRSHPRSALVLLHLGLARFQAGHDRDAVAAWRAAERVDPDSTSAVRASDLLHPNMVRGLPGFVPSFAPPKQQAGLSAARQLEMLKRAARAGRTRALLLYGVALQRLERPISAERAFSAAAARSPDDPEAQVAAAVGRFDKDRPVRAFSRLGPLTRVFPRAATVRFHLGLLLLWIGQVAEAKRQLALARADEPSSPLGREANRFLLRLERIGPGTK